MDRIQKTTIDGVEYELEGWPCDDDIAMAQGWDYHDEDSSQHAIGVYLAILRMCAKYGGKEYSQSHWMPLPWLMWKLQELANLKEAGEE